jgi:hypothetical protein
LHFLPEQFGFRNGDRGTHTSRTIMLAELRILLEMHPATATKAEYWASITEGNILGKKTGSTRRLSAQRLSELYGLDPGVTLFRLLRFFWDLEDTGRALLAFLCAIARDPLLRLTAPTVLAADQGSIVTTKAIEATIADAAPDRFNAATRHKIARNVASSWTQSGHLTGRTRKIRSHPIATPTNAAYALTLGYLAGARGQFLFDTFWMNLLDIPHEQLSQLIIAASQRGWVNYKKIGSIVEVRFPDILTVKEQEWLHGQG